MDEATSRKVAGLVKHDYFEESTRDPNAPGWRPTQVERHVYYYHDSLDPEGYIAHLIDCSKDIEDGPPPQAAWDTLWTLARELLGDGKRLPDGLADWVADVLGDYRQPRKRRKRPRPRKDPANRWRDTLIRAAIRDVKEKFDCEYTRAGGPVERFSACDAVAEAFELEYKNVERIWSARRRQS